MLQHPRVARQCALSQACIHVRQVGGVHGQCLARQLRGIVDGHAAHGWTRLPQLLEEQQELLGPTESKHRNEHLAVVEDRLHHGTGKTSFSLGLRLVSLHSVSGLYNEDIGALARNFSRHQMTILLQAKNKPVNAHHTRQRRQTDQTSRE